MMGTMEDLPSPKTSDASASINVQAPVSRGLEIGLVNKATKEFKILGIRHDDGPTYLEPPPPHKIGDRLILTEGKFPLTDYNDIGKHRLTFTNTDGLQIIGLLDGFSWQCAAHSDPNPRGGHIVILLDT
jgi:hypothetical protein